MHSSLSRYAGFFIASLCLLPTHVFAKTTAQDIIQLLQRPEKLPVSVEERVEEQLSSSPRITGPRGYVKEGKNCPAPTSLDKELGIAPLCLYEQGSKARSTKYAYTLTQRAVSSTTDIDAEGQIAVTTYETNNQTPAYPHVIPSMLTSLLDDPSLREMGKKFNRPFRYAWRLIGNDMYLNIQEVPLVFWKSFEASTPGAAQKIIGVWQKSTLPAGSAVRRNPGTDFPLDLAKDLTSMKPIFLDPTYPYEINPSTIIHLSVHGQPRIRFAMRIKSTYIHDETERLVQKNHATSTQERARIETSVRHDTDLLKTVQQTWTLDATTGHLLEARNARRFTDELPIGCVRNTKTKRDVCKNTMMRRTTQNVTTTYRYDQSQPVTPPTHWIALEAPGT